MYKSLKTYLIFAGIGIIFAFLGYSWYISKELEKNTTTLTRVYGKFCSKITEDETSVIFNEIIRKIDFPVIVTNKDGEIIASRNLKNPSNQTILSLDKFHEPVKIEYGGEVLAWVHYGDNRARQLLRWAPYVQLIVAIIIVAIGFLWLRTVKRSTENFIWAGIAKETAHQMGTPLSSLAGWAEHIKDKKIRDCISRDIDRISGVTTRFHKIGSPSKFQIGNLSEIARETVEYLKKRFPKNVKIIEKYSDKTNLHLDKELISWAIENLVKNSIDADAREIEISTSKHGRYAKLLVKDNGKGMTRAELIRAFNPGYTTKEYGWGLGLTLVKRIIVMHKGKIFAKREKRNTIFTLMLPLK